MPYFVATYAYTDDVDRRNQVRPAHRTWLGGLPSLVVSGPTDAEGAVLIFEGADAGEVTAVLDGDPFTREGGIIGERAVVGWTPVSGRLAGSF